MYKNNSALTFHLDRGIPPNQIKVTFIIILPSIGTFVIFSLFHIEIKGKGGWITGGRAKGMLHPLSNYWGRGQPPAPLPTPMHSSRLTVLKQHQANDVD